MKQLYLMWYEAIDLMPEPMRSVYLAALLTAEFKMKWSK